MVRFRVVSIAVTGVLALSVPAVAAAVGPEPEDRGYCPGGQIIGTVAAKGGRFLGDVMRTHRERTELTFGGLVRLTCLDHEVS